MSFWHGVRDWNSGFGTIYLLGTQDARAIKALRHSRHLRTRALGKNLGFWALKARYLAESGSHVFKILFECDWFVKIFRSLLTRELIHRHVYTTRGQSLH